MKIFLFTLGAVALFAQAQQKQAPAPMTFFITSTGVGNGANLGGLAGAVARRGPRTRTGQLPRAVRGRRRHVRRAVLLVPLMSAKRELP